MSQCLVQCSNCSYTLSELPNFIEVAECPKCSSLDRHITAVESFRFHEQIRLSAKDPKRTGKKKVRKQVISGDDFHVSSGKWNEKVRIIDVDNDHYFEKITDPETGKVIHFCEEPLSKHLGHGSAKQKSN